MAQVEDQVDDLQDERDQVSDGRHCAEVRRHVPLTAAEKL